MLGTWKRVNAQGFSLELPPFMRHVVVQGIDSSVGRWEGPGLLVQFDHGRFADPLTLYTSKDDYERRELMIGGRPATIVAFRRSSERRFTGVHFPDLGHDAYGQEVKLSVVLESDVSVGDEILDRIIGSIDFQLD